MSFEYWPLLVVAALACIVGVTRAQGREITLRCIADSSICTAFREQTHEAEAAGHLKCKGNEYFLVFDFDTTSIEGRRVTEATLCLRSAIPNPMFRKVSVSTVSAPWTEGEQPAPGTAEPGDGNSRSPLEHIWAGTGLGSAFADVSFGLGGTFWHSAYLEAPKDGWFAIPVEPRIVDAMRHRFSFGLSVADDNGEVKYIAREVAPDTCFDKNAFYSRDAGEDGPRLVVTVVDQAETVPPGAVADLAVEPWPTAATFEAGAARVTWTASGDEGERGRALGYVVALRVGAGERRALPSWRVPVPLDAGQPVRLVLDGLPPQAAIAVDVVGIGTSGKRSVPAAAAGRASAPRARPPRLEAVPLPTSAGAEPPVRGGAMRVWAFGDGLRVNPLNGNLLEEPGVEYAGPPDGAYRRANAAWDGATGTIRLRGARGEWVAFQLVVEAAGEEAPSLTGVGVSLTGLPGQDPKDLVWLEHSDCRRAWYLKSGDAWYADPLVPLGGPFDVPWEQNQVPGQRNQTLYVEFFISKHAAAGPARAALRLSADGVEPFTLPIEAEVLPFTIPDEVHFVWSMNAYGSPGGPWGEPDARKYLAVERDYYVVSHVHRTCLVTLHYRHAGLLRDEAAPAIAGTGRETRVADWSTFDRRFGPLFDGSAFEGTPRDGIPIDHFYLPFHENWPTTMAEGYRWNVPHFEDHWRVCGPPAEGFSQAYQDAWKALLSDYARHVREKGWAGTRLQVFLNNKYYYKRYNEKTGRHGEGTSFWCLDEPQFRDDFLALAFLHRITREALGGRDPTIVLRSDISTPQWQREILDGLIDFNVTSAYPRHARQIDRRRAEFGETLWVYGHLGEVDSSTLTLEARALRMYTGLVDGFVPWQTLGKEDSWREADRTAAFYPGKPVGIDGCVPSLRLKVCRRGEQDVEYLWLLGQALGLDRRGTAALGDQVLRLTDVFRDTPRLGTRGEQYQDLTDADFDHFRRVVAAELARISSASPAVPGRPAE